MERSHRSDDEEFYTPFLLNTQDGQELLEKAEGWEYFYNLVRPHYGEGITGKAPFQKLKGMGYALPGEFTLLPPVSYWRLVTLCWPITLQPSEVAT